MTAVAFGPSRSPNSGRVRPALAALTLLYQVACYESIPAADGDGCPQGYRNCLGDAVLNPG